MTGRLITLSLQETENLTMTSAICNQCAGSATVENKTGPMSVLLGRMNAGNKGAPEIKGGWGIETVLELDRKSLQTMNKAKHRRQYRRYPLSMEKAYMLNQWRYFVKPKWRRAWLELLVKFQTKFQNK